MKALLILSLFTLGAVKALQAPHIGVYLMSWLGYMNPHRMVPWSFVYNLPFAAMAFAVTLIGYVFYKEKPNNWFAVPLVYLVLMLIWSIICTYNGFFPDYAENELLRFFKIQLIIFLTVMIIRSKEQIIYLIWVIYLSVGFYGIKGGVFTLLTGGQYLVWGPEGSFIEGNNEMGLALLIILPLGYFLFQQYSNIWIKTGLVISMLLMTVSVLGTYSRGAFLALICMGIFLWYKSRSKLAIGAIALVGILLFLPFMPEQWSDRMDSIQNYEQDASAMGRINAWTVAVNVANDRLTGGGFGHWGTLTFRLYAPEPENVHDAHSIYFEVLGELGYPGLILFLLILVSIWFGARSNLKRATQIGNIDKHNSQEWIIQLNRMIPVSLVAYMSGGAFLGLAYWDLPYHLLAITICCSKYLSYSLEEESSCETRQAANPIS
jgi:probable O-glycosylation ligase (exosortase A-associated)